MNTFNPYDYAYEAYSETLNYMSEDEINEISTLESDDEVREYMSQFIERT
jgi:hypothetical protein